MLFNSLEFLIFFPTVVLLFFAVPHRFRWVILLVSSYFFYMSWSPLYGLLLFGSTLSVYLAGLLIGRTKEQRVRQGYLALALCINLGILFVFKYFNFAASSLSDFSDFIGYTFSAPTLQLLLPVGISFYTFQALSYVIDVYRNTRPPERHFGIFALYVSFFPQLVAGPIETSTRLLPQFYKKVSPSLSRTAEGIRLMLWGFFKKIVIADNAALIVNTVYGNAGNETGITLFVATFFFAVQIYGDFSGYSDIARGAARILGYDLILNFRQPYFARSVGDFWRRWHISLMHWFREYIYIPLGGSRVPKTKIIRNIFIIFLISGIWHGANWTFIVWGILNGIFIIFERSTERARANLRKLFGFNFFPRFKAAFQMLTTFILILITWTFFRAESITEALSINHKIFADIIELLSGRGSLLMLDEQIGSLGIEPEQLTGLLLGIVLLIVIDILLEKNVLKSYTSKIPRFGIRITDYALVAFIIFFGNFGSQAFIYFQF